MTALYIILGALYLLLGRRFAQSASPNKDKWFAWLNVGFLFLAIYFTYSFPYLRRHFILHVSIALGMTAIYAGGAVLLFRLLKRGETDRSAYTIAFWLPLAALILFKLMGMLANLGVDEATWLRERVLLIGLSYLSFKLSYSVWEIRNGRIPLPGFHTFMGYALYVPTLFVGPINPISAQCGTALPVPKKTELRPHILRMAMGLLKMTFLAGLVERLGYKALVTSAATTAPVDYFIAPIANFIFLYLNFAGACDIAIAGSALMGIYAKENFNRPFLARNVQDFWSRWHMTLSMFFKDIVFTPLVTWLTGKIGARNVNHAIAAAILIIFLLIGLWHGTTANFLLIGLIYGGAVVFNHYYALIMKSLLGKSYKKVHNHPVVTWLSIALTFWFVSTTALLLNYDVASFTACLKGMAHAVGIL